MVKINVASPLKREEMKQIFASQTNPTYQYLGMLSDIEMQFEVDDSQFDGDVLRYTKKLIQEMPFGNVLVYRVLYDGQIWDNGPIFKPGDPEYDSTHHGLKKE